jgi:hypothetical protein
MLLIIIAAAAVAGREYIIQIFTKIFQQVMPLPSN